MIRELRTNRRLRMMFRLALALGRTVRELSETLSPAEFEWWLAFSEVDPIGTIHDERRAALQIMASYRGKHPITLEEISGFLANSPEFGTDPETRAAQQAAKNEAQLRAFCAVNQIPVVKREER